MRRRRLRAGSRSSAHRALACTPLPRRLLGCDETAQNATLCATRAEGALSPGLANCSHLTALDLSSQNLTGALPAAWGAPGALPELQFL